MYVAYGSLAGAFNNISVTTADGAFVDKLGNFDGGGASFSADQLAAAGVTPVPQSPWMRASPPRSTSPGLLPVPTRTMPLH
ncbi:hypothetical protein NHF46_21790 [Arthrobacter alpinus]|nr:hypothetical protein [Arthrobacter alpinus]